MHASPIPLSIKLAASLFVAVLAPVYWWHYGLLHFLWISDVALFLTLAALWRESRRLNSMLVLGALPFELFWNVDFWGQLVSGRELFGLASYMFDPQQRLLLRGLSLFHVPMPIIWVWLLLKWGYDRRAFKLQTMLFLAVIGATYLLTDPERNINWVFSPRSHGWDWMPQPLWVGLYMFAVPALVYWPLHRLLVRLYEPRTAAPS